MHQIKPYEELTICDPFMFGKVTQDPEIATLILSALLTTDISISHSAMEHRIQLLKEKKFVRLDLFAIDENGTNYDAEMQNESKNLDKQKELPKRSRYYQCMVDGQILESGKDYLDMPDSYIIFICDFDPFGKEKYQYSFSQKCNEDATICLNDGAHIIFFNYTADYSTAPKPLRNMLEYFATGNAKDSSAKTIDAAVSKAREMEEWRHEYMFTFVHDKDVYRDGYHSGFNEGHDSGFKDGHDSGFKDGHDSGFKDAIIKMIQTGDITIETGAKQLHISVAELTKIVEAK